ncbi:MAG: heme-binding protein [Nitriliruptorales bacterium]|nr:heme-binding protein [Nitriliruptorales bacterium]
MKSREIGVPMCTAITDDTGLLLAFEREDGGKPTSVSIAIDKAYTAAGARRPTRFYGERTTPDGPTWGIHTSNGGRFNVIPGGLPLVLDGAVIGGVGCSSGTGDEDEQVAQAAIDHLYAKLNEGA